MRLAVEMRKMEGRLDNQGLLGTTAASELVVRQELLVRDGGADIAAWTLCLGLGPSGLGFGFGP